jgi:hypothetical protein
MWTIGNFHLEIVSRPRPPIFTSENRIFTTSPGRRNWGYRSRIALKIYEHVPANNVYTGKILRQSETTKTQLFFDSGA